MNQWLSPSALSFLTCPARQLPSQSCSSRPRRQTRPCPKRTFAIRRNDVIPCSGCCRRLRYQILHWLVLCSGCFYDRCYCKSATNYSQILVLKTDDNRNELCDEIRENETREKRLKQWLPLSGGNGGYWNPTSLRCGGNGGAIGRTRFWRERETWKPNELKKLRKSEWTNFQREKEESGGACRRWGGKVLCSYVGILSATSRGKYD